MRHDLDALKRYIMEREIELVDLPFTAINHLVSENGGLEEVASLRHLISAGEPWSVTAALRRLLAARPEVTLYNHYGPSETHMLASHAISWHRDNLESSPPLGKPISNMRAYVLDDQLELAPIGAVGELCIAGPGLARGYMSPMLTAAKYVPHPHVYGARIYRSDDLARWRPDGTIELLGRRDALVKIRGYRVELQEIEAQLRGHPQVRQCVVVARRLRAEQQELVAYVTAASKVNVSRLRAYLARTLPEFMIPAHFVQLEEIPRSPNGKADRSALPMPSSGRPELEHPYETPRTGDEEVLAQIWARVLEVDRVGISDNFFDLGGHSLLATRLMAEIRRVYQLEFPLRALFEAPTIRDLARLLDRARTENAAPVPITPAAPDHSRQLSFGQERIFFLEMLHPGTATYNLGAGFFLRGHVDVTALELAFADVVQRHESLRTTFHGAARPFREVCDQTGVLLPLIDLGGLSGLPEARPEAVARQLTSMALAKPFSLEAGPLFRAALLRLRPDLHALIVNMHHIIGDAWSISIILSELSSFYEKHVGLDARMPEPPEIQYSDFAAWQRAQQTEHHTEYWRRQLQGTARVRLPTMRSRPAVPSFRGGSCARPLPLGVARQALDIFREERVTPFMGFLAVFAALLARYSGHGDISIGTPVSGRGQPETNSLVGYLVNTLVLRVDAKGEPSFRELLDRVRRVCLDAYAHQDVPFERLVMELDVTRNDLTQSPLFQVFFLLQDEGQLALTLPGLDVQRLDNPAETAKFDITFVLRQRGEDLNASLEFSRDVFDDVQAERLLAHFATMLEAAIATPDMSIGELPLCTGGERALHARLVDVEREFPAEQTLHGLLEQAAHAHRDSVAVQYGDSCISYGALHRQSDNIAAILQDNGVCPDDVVAICLDRSLEIIIAIVGVLKAGGAYVLIDPSEPARRVHRQLTLAGVRHVITDDRATHHFGQASILRMGHAAISDGHRRPRKAPCSSSSLAYVMFTSGSTGDPKGVAVTHRGIVNYLAWALEELPFAEGTGTIVHSPLRFDLLLDCVFGPLICGRTLILTPPAPGIMGLHKAVLENPGVSLLKMTPTHLTLLVEELSVEDAALLPRVQVVSGEASTRQHVHLWRGLRPDAIMVNAYGPTENIVACTAHTLQPDDLVGERFPIGRPVANARSLLVDGGFQPVPVGVPGELLVGGEAIARGYIGQPGQTAARFVPDPSGVRAGARVYRTGDTVRMLEDGTLEYLGRGDRQIKIGGWRIEPGEIEAALTSLDGVQSALVMERKGQLVAYFVPRSGRVVTEAQLIAHLHGRLPAPFVPRAFVPVDGLPARSSGKLDETALPAPTLRTREDSTTYVEPASELERAVAAIWAEALGMDRVGRTDNFFQLGGNSLIAMGMVSAAKQQLGKEISLRVIFECPVLGDFVSVVEGGAPLAAPAPSGALPSSEAILRGDIDTDALSDAEVESLLREILDAEGEES